LQKEGRDICSPSPEKGVPKGIEKDWTFSSVSSLTRKKEGESANSTNRGGREREKNYFDRSPRLQPP